MVPVLCFSNNEMNMRNHAAYILSVQPGIAHFGAVIQTANHKLPIIGIDRPLALM